MMPFVWNKTRQKREKLEGRLRSGERLSPSPTTPEFASNPILPPSGTAVMGIRSPVHSFTPCFVICNTWPGWLAVLPSFGFQCTHLVSSYPSAAWLSLMLRPHPGYLLLRLHPHSLPSELSLYQYGFMQGSSRLAQFCPTFSSINFI